MDVEIEEAERRGLVSEYSGRLFHFCSAGCKRLFDDDPTAYAGHLGLQEDAGDAAEDFPSAGE